MKYKPPRNDKEAREAKALVSYARQRGWLCKKTHGNKYSEGWPDYYFHHPTFGPRWVETKTQEGSLTPAQRKTFTEWSYKFGVPIWIVNGIEDYDLIVNGRPNCREYLAHGQRAIKKKGIGL